MSKIINTRLRLKKDTSANWELNNPVLLDGEKILVVTNAGEIREKVGDGTKTYTQLPFTDEAVRTLISNKVDKVQGKGLSTNDYTTTEKNKLAGIAANANNYSHPSSHPATMITQDSSHRFVTDAEKSSWNSKPSTSVASSTANGLMSKDDKIKLDGIAEGANNYSHPTYTSKTSGLYKITVDGTGHVSGTTAVSKSDITGLGIPAQDTTYGVATTTTNGLMSSDDKTKLDGIAAGANNYSHPTYTSRSSGLYKVTVDSTGHVSAATLVAKADITALGIPGKDTTYSTMTGATTSAAGTTGLVPAPEKGAANRYLRSDGAWVVPPNDNTTYGVATTTSNGLMSSTDKTKLDGIAAGANNYTHPSSHAATMITQDSTHRFVTDTEKSTWNAKVGLDSNGFIPSSVLPSYVDDVIEGYYNSSKFYKTRSGSSGSYTYSNEITGETGKIYINLENNKTYRWSGSAYAVISETLALGETSSTAYPGNKGKANADAITNIVNGTTKVGKAGNADTVNGLAVQTAVPANAKFTDTVYTHPTSSGNKHIPSGGSAGQILRWSADGTAAWGADNNTTYSVATTSANGLMSSSDKSKLDGIATGANKYSHPTYTARSAGLYKITVDGTGHVSAVTAVAKADITGLGIPAQDTTYSVATTSANGLMSSDDKTKLNGITAGANKVTISDDGAGNVTISIT